MEMACARMLRAWIVYLTWLKIDGQAANESYLNKFICSITENCNFI